ncbi:MAG: MaoC family dehydratase [SAR324 cluster bacterium]|jgi:acyl dehydratase|uniref:MaoC-like domain-containing protein n=1 Tax=marine metagenome TaxID=408172 RepID=A0A381NCW9_9ZZZZ|nr:MaoC family dehydratase [SAR324 cluster bacterium]MDP7439272.1 MaoC family dehydratase [SAR324 cluster bacterium]HCV45391.1 dehydratase [Deltaproteobacteria bacterium]|tara:strand:+ start:1156 stop:1572 length:417 start_codon:yes stop_codon:yes gene_type:complete
MTLPKFDSLNVGDEIPALTTPLVSRHILALYCGASGDHNPIHVDLDFAKSSGLDDVIAHGMLSAGYLAQMLTNWIPQSALRSFNNRFTAMTQIGDTVTCSGKIVEKFEKDGEKFVRLELYTNTPQAQTIVAEAEVVLT